MSTHAAVVTVALRAPLAIHQVPTVKPVGDEVRVRVEWTASSPVDLHQNDGGLLVTHPQILGDSVAGTVVEVGPNLQTLAVGDRVFGFVWREEKEKAHQEYVTISEYLLGKVPDGFTLQEAVTIPDNFVTAWHTITKELGLPLPFPRPENYTPPRADDPILIWGASSSVGQYVLQLLKHYGYRNILATASKQHHEFLRSIGAMQVFDYREANVTDAILEAVKALNASPLVPLILDCIGSKKGSLAPISRIAQKGTKLAVMLPIIVRDATDDVAPEYAMDVRLEADSKAGVEASGVRTHFYLENPFAKEHLQPTVMPKLLAEKVVTPQKRRIVEGKTLLERAQKALNALRRKEVSGERLVWRISEP